MNFNKYQHIERYGTSEVEGITLGECYIFPKIDGTNASIWLDNDELKAGSRNRELTIEKDNAGFYNWVLNNKDKFLPFFKKYPQYRLYGEWLVPHTIKTYRDTAWRNFYIFDITVLIDENKEKYLSYTEYQPLLEQFGFEYINPQKIIKNPTFENLNKELENNHYLMPNDTYIGEGIVIKNYDYVNKYGRQIWAKIVRTEFKENHDKLMGSPVKENVLIEQEIVDKYVTIAFVLKEKAKIENECNGWTSKLIPRLFNTVWHELINEEMWHIIKEFKNPKIDFKILYSTTVLKIKATCPEIFS